MLWKNKYVLFANFNKRAIKYLCRLAYKQINILYFLFLCDILINLSSYIAFC